MLVVLCVLALIFREIWHLCWTYALRMRALCIRSGSLHIYVLSCYFLSIFVRSCLQVFPWQCWLASVSWPTRSCAKILFCPVYTLYGKQKCYKPTRQPGPLLSERLVWHFLLWFSTVYSLMLKKIPVSTLAHSLSNCNWNSSEGLVRPSKSDSPYHIRCLFFTEIILCQISIILSTHAGQLSCVNRMLFTLLIDSESSKSPGVSNPD